MDLLCRCLILDYRVISSIPPNSSIDNHTTFKIAILKKKHICIGILDKSILFFVQRFILNGKIDFGKVHLLPQIMISRIVFFFIQAPCECLDNIPIFCSFKFCILFVIFGELIKNWLEKQQTIFILIDSNAIFDFLADCATQYLQEMSRILLALPFHLELVYGFSVIY